MNHSQKTKKHISSTKHFTCSYECAGEFKSSRSFYWLSWLHKETKNQYTWSFFEIGHGNGEHDGASSCVKWALRIYQISHDVVRPKDSGEVVNWCKLHLGHEGHEQVRSVPRFFWNVEIGDVNRFMTWYCDTICGTRELHFMHSKDMGNILTIKTRKYACFCEFCIGTYGCGLDQCEKNEYVKQWKCVSYSKGSSSNSNMEINEH